MFIHAIVRICERERIDVIYPSWDPYVYVLSKNMTGCTGAGRDDPRPRLRYRPDRARQISHHPGRAGRGVSLPRIVPLRIARTTRRAADRLGYPLVVKPRFTSGGHGMAIVRDRGELDAALPAILRKHGPPLVQEYIPGGKRDSVQFVMGRDGEVLFAFHKQRTARFGARRGSARCRNRQRPRHASGSIVDAPATTRMVGRHGH